jgi:hypothetical protein
MQQQKVNSGDTLCAEQQKDPSEAQQLSTLVFTDCSHPGCYLIHFLDWR